MWNINGKLIQLEMGSNVIKAYTPADKRNLLDLMFGQSPPQAGKLLFSQEQQLRKVLTEQGIPLPEIEYSLSADIGSNMYRAHIGIVYYLGDYTVENPFNVIVSWLKRFHMRELTSKNISNLLRQGSEKLVKRDIQSSLYDFAQVYYCASLNPEFCTQLVSAALNICAIEAINGKFDDALNSARRACSIANSGGFYDPYLKYHSNNWMAGILAKTNNLADALKCYINAYSVIKETNEQELKISALWNVACLSIQCNNFQQSVQALDMIVDISKNDSRVNLSKEFFTCLYEFKSFILSLTISRLQQDYTVLKRECEKMSSNFLYKIGDTALTIVLKSGPALLGAWAGSLLSGNKITQINTSGSNVCVI